MDCGNNNYIILILVKVNIFFNGIDFLIYCVIGWFCNGKIFYDVLGKFVFIDYDFGNNFLDIYLICLLYIVM